jgi:hypothetical protein
VGVRAGHGHSRWITCLRPARIAAPSGYAAGIGLVRVSPPKEYDRESVLPAFDPMGGTGFRRVMPKQTLDDSGMTIRVKVIQL